MVQTQGKRERAQRKFKTGKLARSSALDKIKRQHLKVDLLSQQVNTERSYFLQTESQCGVAVNEETWVQIPTKLTG